MALEHSIGMKRFHARRTPEQKAATSQKLSDAAACRLWVRNGRGNPSPSINSRPGPRKKQMDPNTKVGTSTLRKVVRSSIAQIMKNLANTRPDLFEDALIEGLMAPPPRSFPYLALCASYIDGRAPAEPAEQPLANLADLTHAELAERAERLVRLLKSNPKALPVINGTVIPSPEDMTLAQLQEEARRAEEDVARAQAEVRRAANAVARAEEELARFRKEQK
jgi:hypothetical protein